MNWLGWLQSPECEIALLKCASNVYKHARRHALPGKLLPCPGLTGLSPEARQECLRELAHELWLFIRDRTHKWDAEHDFSVITAGDSRGPENWISFQYIQYLREQARTIDVDPAKALYRRLRQILQQEPDIAYQAVPRKGVSYSFDPDAETFADLAELTMTPYREWEPPPGLVSIDDLSQRENLLRVARHFWEETKSRLHVSCLVPLRELVRYISAHYPAVNLPATVSIDATTPPDGASSRGSTRDIAVSSSPDVELTHGRLQELAKDAVSSWTDREKLLFYSVEGQDQTLTAAATEFGYSSASGVSYAIRTLRTRLRDFCLLWAGLSPPDLDENLLQAFIEIVFEICKSSVEGR